MSWAAGVPKAGVGLHSRSLPREHLPVPSWAFALDDRLTLLGVILLGVASLSGPVSGGTEGAGGRVPSGLHCATLLYHLRRR